MPVLLAKTAGFCFGVNKAVQRVHDLLDAGEKVCTLGPIIHNPQVVEALAARGVRTVEKPADTPSGAVLVIRSHGVPKSTMEEIEQGGIRYSDATCPFVAKIHRIVAKQSAAGGTVLIAGNPEHPEILGIRGHCEGSAFTFQSTAELENCLKENPELGKLPCIMVAQTTFNSREWEKCCKKAKKC